jgi:hypothetical protein
MPLLDKSIDNNNQNESIEQQTKFDSKSIPLLHTMSAQLRELELPTSLYKRYLFKSAPVFVPSHEYIVFPMQMSHYDNRQTMFEQSPNNVNRNTIGSYVHAPIVQQPPQAILLEQYQQRDRRSLHTDQHSTSNSNDHNRPSIEWDGRSDDPSRSHIRQFDMPYQDHARQAIWINNWAHGKFTTTTDDRGPINGIRIPASAQFIAAAAIVGDASRYENIFKNQQRNIPYNHDQAENDTDLTSITKDSDNDNDTQQYLPSSPRRREVSFRKSSVEESTSLPIMSNDQAGELARSFDFRAPSRETAGDETPTYNVRDFPTHYYDGPDHADINYRQMSSPHSNRSSPVAHGHRQQQRHRRTVQPSLDSQRFLDDTDPYKMVQLEQEEHDRYTQSGRYYMKPFESIDTCEHTHENDTIDEIIHSALSYL